MSKHISLKHTTCLFSLLFLTQCTLFEADLVENPPELGGACHAPGEHRKNLNLYCNPMGRFWQPTFDLEVGPSEGGWCVVQGERQGTFQCQNGAWKASEAAVGTFCPLEDGGARYGDLVCNGDVWLAQPPPMCGDCGPYNCVYGRCTRIESRPQANMHKLGRDMRYDEQSKLLFVSGWDGDLTAGWAGSIYIYKFDPEAGIFQEIKQLLAPDHPIRTAFGFDFEYNSETKALYAIEQGLWPDQPEGPKDPVIHIFDGNKDWKLAKSFTPVTATGDSTGTGYQDIAVVNNTILLGQPWMPALAGAMSLDWAGRVLSIDASTGLAVDLTAATPVAWEEFGRAMAVSGNRLFVAGRDNIYIASNLGSAAKNGWSAFTKIPLNRPRDDWRNHNFDYYDHAGGFIVDSSYIYRGDPEMSAIYALPILPNGIGKQVTFRVPSGGDELGFGARLAVSPFYPGSVFSTSPGKDSVRGMSRGGIYMWSVKDPSKPAWHLAPSEVDESLVFWPGSMAIAGQHFVSATGGDDRFILGKLP